jgi:hypothetical protein
MTKEELNVDPSWKGAYKAGGFCLFAAGAIVAAFVLLVLISQQTLPVPAKEMLESPQFPALLFCMTAIGELLLLPGAMGLYVALKGVKQNAMLMATGFLAVAVPMFLASRGAIISLSQISDRYLQTTDVTMKSSYLATAELALETQNIYSAMAVILLCVWSIIVGVVMLKGPLGKYIGYVVIAAGVFTLFTPFGVIFMDVPIILPFIGLVLSGVWQLIVGVKLYRLG